MLFFKSPKPPFPWRALIIAFKFCIMVEVAISDFNSWSVVPKARTSEIRTVWIPSTISFGFCSLSIQTFTVLHFIVLWEIFLQLNVIETCVAFTKNVQNKIKCNSVKLGALLFKMLDVAMYYGPIKREISTSATKGIVPTKTSRGRFHKKIIIVFETPTVFGVPSFWCLNSYSFWC